MAPNRDNGIPLAEADLDTLFEAARNVDGPVGESLIAKVVADAAAVMPDARPVAAGPARRHAGPGRGWLARLVGMAGGLPAAAGLAMAGMTGLAVGYLDTWILDDTAVVLGFDTGLYDVGDLYAPLPGAE